MDAAVETLKVSHVSPPVPTMSRTPACSNAGQGIAKDSMASALAESTSAETYSDDSAQSQSKKQLSGVEGQLKMLQLEQAKHAVCIWLWRKQTPGNEVSNPIISCRQTLISSADKASPSASRRKHRRRLLSMLIRCFYVIK